MAKRDRNESSEDESTGTEGTTPSDVNPDGDGWGRVNPFDGERFFFRKEEGATLQGILVGRYARKNDDEAFYYQIKITKPSDSVVDKDGNKLLKEVGTIVTVDESSALMDLKPLVSERPDDGKVCEVFIRCLEKQKLAGGKSYWRFDVRSRRAKEKDLLPF